MILFPKHIPTEAHLVSNSSKKLDIRWDSAIVIAL